MPTDDERRRVAERMRMADERDAADFDCLLAEAVRGREFCETPCESCHRRLLAELADLIESSIDRDALLDLATDMETWAEMQRCAGSIDDPAANRIEHFADRIRDACGEVPDGAEEPLSQLEG